MNERIHPGELAVRIETATIQAPYSDDGEQAREELKQFLLDHVFDIIFYLNFAANKGNF